MPHLLLDTICFIISMLKIRIHWIFAVWCCWTVLKNLTVSCSSMAGKARQQEMPRLITFMHPKQGFSFQIWILKKNSVIPKKHFTAFLPSKLPNAKILQSLPCCRADFFPARKRKTFENFPFTLSNDQRSRPLPTVPCHTCGMADQKVMGGKKPIPLPSWKNFHHGQSWCGEEPGELVVGATESWKVSKVSKNALEQSVRSTYLFI